MNERIKEIIKNPLQIFFTLGHRGFLNWMKDETYLKLGYRIRMGKKLNLEDPKTYNEKLQWLKLYDRKPEYTIMVDKYQAKQYIAERIGQEYIIPTLGIWDSFDEIDFDKLPEQFVLKCTHDSGGLIICKDKSKLNLKKARKKINTCLKHNFFWAGREWPYKNVKPRIIAEAYLEDDSGCGLQDYKIMCFGGEPKILLIVSHPDAFSKEHYNDYYDMDLQLLPYVNGQPNAHYPIQLPHGLEQMKALARTLSRDFAHLRVDFYECNGQIYVGELTFSHGSGMTPFEPDSWDRTLGDWITLSMGKQQEMES